jgi:hypothetical protein
MHLVNRGVREVFVHCLTENGAMMHLARRNGMRVVRDGPETDAYLALPRATAGSVIAEWFWDHNARSAHEMRRGTRRFLDLIGAFRPHPAR